MTNTTTLNETLINEYTEKYHLDYVWPYVTLNNAKRYNTPVGYKYMTPALYDIYEWCPDAGHTFSMIPMQCLPEAIESGEFWMYACPVSYSYVMKHGYYLLNKKIPIVDCAYDETGVLCGGNELDWNDFDPAPIAQMLFSYMDR